MAAPGDHVLEIGPGRGALSVHLKERFPDFHLVEFDADVVAELTAKLGAGQWVLHECDALRFDFLSAGSPLHVVGNLPYSIAAMIIKKTLLYAGAVSTCTFMVQREVAQRIAAGPHCRRNGFLSIFCQFFGQPRIVFHVPAGAFFPRPKVESSVFRMVISDDHYGRLPREQWDGFFRFVDKGFGMRRKTLVNALGRDREKAAYGEALHGLGIDPSARAEDLAVEQWLELYGKVRCV